MKSSRRSAPFVTTMLLWLALGALALGILAVGAVVVETAGTLAQQHPEFAYLQGPLIALAVVFGICLEAVLIITALLVGSIYSGHIFGPTASKLVDALVAVLMIASGVLIAVLLVTPGPPALSLAIFGGALAGATFTLVVVVLRSLLQQAAHMRLELDEVI